MAAISKVSEITNEGLAVYLKLEFEELSDAEKFELDMFLNVAKAFIRSYTGIRDDQIAEEIVGTGDGVQTVFYVQNHPIVPDSQTIYVDSLVKTKDVDYVFKDIYGVIGFTISSIPAVGEVITASYGIGLDAYPDFVIVVYVLVQDMYDNRSLYVDKNNLNKVVDTILGMHSINLL